MRTDRTNEDMGQWATFRADLSKGWRILNKRSSVGHKRLVWFLVLAGAALRISQLGLGITYDEAFTYTYYASRPLGFIVQDYTWPNNHILHTVLVKMSTALFGVHAWSLRLPALLAGVLVLPLFYAFVRAMFNRYIAGLTLSLLAASGALIEYSALARGYSLSWLFMVVALLAGRYFAKRNNFPGALLVAVSCALGMWVVPSMAYAALAVYFWLLLYLFSAYETSLNKRLVRLGISFGTFLLLSALAYAPVVAKHSMDHLLHHPALGDRNWSSFVQTHQDKVFALWAFFNDEAATWVSIIGIIGLVYAAYISTKYRVIVLSLLVGSVPLVLLQRSVAPPEAWGYVLFALHLSSGIAVFYALKFLQAKVFTRLGKRTRTVVASVVLLAGMGGLGLWPRSGGVARFTDAGRAAGWFNGLLKPGDRVCAEYPIDAPFEFALITEGMDRSLLHNGPAPGGKRYVLVGPADGQTIESVLSANDQRNVGAASLLKVKDWRRLEIFAAP